MYEYVSALIVVCVYVCENLSSGQEAVRPGRPGRHGGGGCDSFV